MNDFNTSSMIDFLDNNGNSQKKESKIITWIKQHIQLIAIIAIILIVVVCLIIKFKDKIAEVCKKLFGPSEKKEQQVETFLSNSVGENDFVNSYIESSIGKFIGKGAQA